jgi:uncharacterized FlaG/YvyC family protein
MREIDEAEFYQLQLKPKTKVKSHKPRKKTPLPETTNPATQSIPQDNKAADQIAEAVEAMKQLSAAQMDQVSTLLTFLVEKEDKPVVVEQANNITKAVVNRCEKKGYIKEIVFERE